MRTKRDHVVPASIARAGLQRFLIDRFAAVTDADYDGILRMLESAERVGFYVLQ